MTIYCISGLGADERVFARLALHAELRYVQWVDPHPSDKLNTYAQRLLNQIDTRHDFLLLGVSFGGIVAQELAQLAPAKAVILISSVSHTAQLPPLRRMPLLKKLLAVLPEHWLMPRRLLAYLFGVKSPQDLALLYQILHDTDPAFMRWALQQLLELKHIPPVPLKLQLHGTADRIIPLPADDTIISVRSGGHFMVFDRAEEISGHINQFLARENLL